jgi:hypothetical protein
VNAPNGEWLRHVSFARLLANRPFPQRPAPLKTSPPEQCAEGAVPVLMPLAHHPRTCMTTLCITRFRGVKRSSLAHQPIVDLSLVFSSKVCVVPLRRVVTLSLSLFLLYSFTHSSRVLLHSLFHSFTHSLFSLIVSLTRSFSHSLTHAVVGCVVGSSLFVRRLAMFALVLLSYSFLVIYIWNSKNEPLPYGWEAVATLRNGNSAGLNFAEQEANSQTTQSSRCYVCFQRRGAVESDNQLEPITDVVVLEDGGRHSIIVGSVARGCKSQLGVCVYVYLFIYIYVCVCR